MLNQNNRLLLALAVVAFGLTIFATVTVSAEPPFMRGDHHGLWRTERLADSLGLSDEQRTALERLQESQRSAMRPAVRKLMAGHKQLRQLSKADAFDEAAAQRLAREQSTVLAEMMVSRTRQRYEMRQLLTATQRQQFDAHAERRGHREP